MTLKEWQKEQKPVEDLIVQASAPDGSDSFLPFPIGMSYGYRADSSQLGSHENLVLCSYLNGTDNRRRPKGLNRRSIEVILQKNGIVNKTLEVRDYFSMLPSYKFVISPEGNGIDCHRHYEALIAGCIPIVEDHPGIREKYKGCPILFTKDYSEITFEYLENVYNSMIETEYDFSCLFLKHYSKDMQNYMKYIGNIWMQRLTGRIWYH